ncbi:probable cytochrome P450 6a23 isoform X2 [Anthonomus grandis grandis]|uniref:probable cytochrome P450 6a23 isoform X2 n=1 Tax=Anthonomus grandis grandis TaxID=2921223 RepID=UPI0021654361|nr:probable cytochrome P450 6a23 isoform X2 [Anthonomus grandis grandis]
MFNTLIFILVVICIFYIRRKYSYWERKNVPGPKPWPIFGNILESFLKKKTVGQIFRQIYSEYDDYPVVGVYRTSDPVLIIRDPEFVNRILGASPFLQKDDEWRETRRMLSPGFTSGKMKNLFPLIEKVNKRLTNYLKQNLNISLETQKLCRRYTLENVALSAFGIEGRNFKNEESEFMKLANSFIAPGTFALSMFQMFPILSNLVSLKVIPKEVEAALIKIIKEVLEIRRHNNTSVNDYLQFIADLSQKQKFDYNEIAGHAATFFEDGYETSALVMSYILYNLAMNQEAQEKIRAEIRNVGSKISYEDLGEMKYLNACISESMRLHPVLEHYTRVCNHPYVYTTSKESAGYFKEMSLGIDKNTVCIIPFGGLCHDKKYFSDPEKFIPERFIDKGEQYKNIFYPFGGGHRICLGQRFGIMQVRMGIIEIIKNFRVSISDKTKVPFEFLPWTVLNKVKHGVWLIYSEIN